jgi:hypothetical protein
MFVPFISRRCYGVAAGGFVAPGEFVVAGLVAGGATTSVETVPPGIVWFTAGPALSGMVWFALRCPHPQSSTTPRTARADHSIIIVFFITFACSWLVILSASKPVQRQPLILFSVWFQVVDAATKQRYGGKPDSDAGRRGRGVQFAC